jgi:hypothetical protein
MVCLNGQGFSLFGPVRARAGRGLPPTGVSAALAAQASDSSTMPRRGRAVASTRAQTRRHGAVWDWRRGWLVAPAELAVSGNLPNVFGD